MSIVTLLAFIYTVVLLCAQFKRRVEETLPIAICSWMFILVPFAMIRHLSWIDGVSVIIVLVITVVFAVRLFTKRITWDGIVFFCRDKLVTPGLLAILLLAAFFLWSSSARHVYHPDEVNYWGTFVRSLWVSDGFVDAARHCTPLFATYTPGMQLLQWLALHVTGGWHESILYAVLFFTNAAFLLPLLSKVNWNRWWIAPLCAGLIVVLPTCLSGSYYAFLSTDGTLGMMLGLSLVLVARSEHGGFERTTLAAVLCGMTMVKESGMALALLVFVFILLSQPYGHQKIWFSAFFAPLAFIALWRGYCAMNALDSFSGQRLQQMFSAIEAGTWTVPQGFTNVAVIFLKQLFTVPNNMNGAWGGMKSLAGLPTALWFFIFTAAPILVSRWHMMNTIEKSNVERKLFFPFDVSPWKPAFFPIIVFIGYTITMVVSFLTIFAPEMISYDSSNIPLLERYCSPLILGLFVLTLSWLALWRPSKRIARSAMALSLAVFLCFTNWQNIETLAPSVYNQRFPDKVKADHIRQEAWLAALDDPACTRILYIDTGLLDARKYALPPISFINLPHEDLDMNDLAASLTAFLQKSAVTHVIANRENAPNRALIASALDFPLEIGVFYRVDWNQGIPVLSAVYP